MEEQLQVLREILSRIQAVSNSKEVSLICKEYVQGEEWNLMLFERVNELSLEIEGLGEEVREERAQLETVNQQYKEQNSKDLALKQNIEVGYTIMLMCHLSIIFLFLQFLHFLNLNYVRLMNFIMLNAFVFEFCFSFICILYFVFILYL